MPVGQPPLALDNFLGAAFIGVVLSTAIFGVTCMQLCLYYAERCAGDGRVLKCFVGGLMVIETLHCMMLATMFYHYAVTHFAHVETLSGTTWSFSVQVALGAVASLLVQCFFAHRIYYLSKRRIVIPVIIVLLSIAHLVIGGILYVRKTFQTTFLSSVHADLPYATIALGLDVACDALITMVMIIYVREGRVVFRRSNCTANFLIIYVMSTGLVTTICALVCVITLATMPGTLIDALFYFVLVRLYSCSLLTLLNNRDNIRSRREHTPVSVFQATIMPRSEASSPGVRRPSLYVEGDISFMPFSESEKEFGGDREDYFEEFAGGDRGVVGVAV